MEAVSVMRSGARRRQRGAAHVEVLVVVGVVVTLGVAAVSAVAAGESEKADKQSTCMQTFSCADGAGGGAVSVTPAAAPVERGNGGGGGGGVGGFFRDVFVGLTMGDFAENPNLATTIGQVAGGFIPVYGQIADARDWGAAAYGVWQGRPGAWTDLGLATVGFIPAVGDGIKGAVRGGREVVGGVGRNADVIVRRGDDVPVPGRAPEVVCQGGVCNAPGQCFAAGTPVATSEGTKSIELVTAGEWVLARDEESGTQSLRRVTRTFVTPDKEVADVGLEANGEVEHLVVTMQHPFFVEGRGWTSVSLLAPGDPIVLANGGTAHVAALTALPKPVTVYNFEVETAHTYFVGNAGAWVHNACSFEDQIARLGPSERVATVRGRAAQVAENRGWERARDVERRNPGRTVYRASDGRLYSVDTQHGRLEVLDSRGRHLGEVDMDLQPTKGPDPSGRHDLRMR